MNRMRKMNPDPEWTLAGAVITIAVGMAGGLSQWFIDILAGRSTFKGPHFVLVAFIGGFMGYLGGSVAVASGFPQWATVLAGSFSASGVVGFQQIVRRLSRVP